MTDSILSGEKPVLIYDGDCGFCVYWARYWQALTGDSVRYAAYQEVGTRYPQITPADFQRAVQYVTPDGRVASGAEASLRTLSHAPGKAWWLALYRHVPGLSTLAERVYAGIARHRPAAYRVSLLLWGRAHWPPRHQATVRLFLAGLALIYLAAFVSLAVQIEGLVGSDGILPLQDYLAAIAERYGVERYWLFPTVFWLAASDAALLLVCWTGALLSLLLLCNIRPRLCLALLFVLYLSLFYAGQVFTSYQWDLLLLESGFLALLLSSGSHLAVWLARWLVFRFMFMSGLVKVLGAPEWRDFSALGNQFATQPLPTPLAWYAARLPEVALQVGTALTLTIELLLPLFIFLPRRLRFLAAGGIIMLQAAILLTGNYNFFNLLAILLCLLLFDDAAIRGRLPRWLVPRDKSRDAARLPRPWARRAVIVYAVGSLVLGGWQLAEKFPGATLPGGVSSLADYVSSWRIINPYGPFGAMSSERAEIIIEGSQDGEHWVEYAFRYKPGAVDRRPTWNIPHQPRLDWQMWVAALGSQQQNPWFGQLLRRLLRNSPAVSGLLKGNPFDAIRHGFMVIEAIAHRRYQALTGYMQTRDVSH